MNLFNQKLCRERIARFDFPSGEKAVQIEKIIASWQYALRDSDLSKTKEKSVQGLFLIKFFEGYWDILLKLREGRNGTLSSIQRQR